MNKEQLCQHFWKWFLENEENILHYEKDPDSIFDALSDELHKINKSLCFELGGDKEKDGKCEFAISAGGNVSAFPDVEKLFDCKPESKYFRIVKFRQRKKSDIGIRMAGYEVSAKDIHYKLYSNGANIGLALFLKNYHDNEELFANIMFILLDTVIGEYDLEMKVGPIDFDDDESENYPGSKTLDKLPEEFDRLYAEICH